MIETRIYLTRLAETALHDGEPASPQYAVWRHLDAALPHRCQTRPCGAGDAYRVVYLSAPESVHAACAEDADCVELWRNDRRADESPYASRGPVMDALKERDATRANAIRAALLAVGVDVAALVSAGTVPHLGTDADAILSTPKLLLLYAESAQMLTEFQPANEAERWQELIDKLAGTHLGSDITDTFNRADADVLGTCSDGVHSWDEWQGENRFLIKDNRLRIWRDSSSAYEYVEAVIDEHKTTTDVDLMATLVSATYQNSWTSRAPKLIARAGSAGTDHYEMAAIHADATSDKITSVYLIKRSGSSDTNLDSAGIGEVDLPQALKFSLAGTTLQGYVAGVKRLDTTDSTFSAGAFGFRAMVYNYLVNVFDWDDFSTSGLGGGGESAVLPWHLFFSGAN